MLFWRKLKSTINIVMGLILWCNILKGIKCSIYSVIVLKNNKKVVNIKKYEGLSWKKSQEVWWRAVVSLQAHQPRCVRLTLQSERPVPYLAHFGSRMLINKCEANDFFIFFNFLFNTYAKGLKFKFWGASSLLKVKREERHDNNIFL